MSNEKTYTEELAEHIATLSGRCDENVEITTWLDAKAETFRTSGLQWSSTNLIVALSECIKAGDHHVESTGMPSTLRDSMKSKPAKEEV